MDIVSFDSVSKSYGDKVVLKDLSLTVDEGEIFGMLGENGAGKTTTMDIITGVTDLDSGDVEIFGMNPAIQTLDVRGKIGVIPEKESPPSSHTPRQYFEFVGDVREIPRSVVQESYEDWSRRLGLTEQLDTICGNLSRGQQQKVMLISAFITKPDLLLIDEPLANLDPSVRSDVKKAIEEFSEDGVTVILSTHQVTVAEELCDRIGILHNGSISKTIDSCDFGAVENMFMEEVNSK